MASVVALSLNDAASRAAGISPRSARLAAGALFEVFYVGSDWSGSCGGYEEQRDD
ncbi:hypothetical protein BGZ93_002709, partial [Podila epicladia]